MHSLRHVYWRGIAALGLLLVGFGGTLGVGRPLPAGTTLPCTGIAAGAAVPQPGAAPDASRSRDHASSRRG